MLRLDKNLLQHTASYLQIPEATALRATCQTVFDARPIRGVKHLRLSSGITKTLAQELFKLESMEVDGIPGPIVKAELAMALLSVRDVRFDRPIRPRAEYRAVEGLPHLEKFVGRIRPPDAKEFIETLVVSSPRLRIFDVLFTQGCGHVMALVPPTAWPFLEELTIRGVQTKVAIPWRSGLRSVEYTGIAMNRPDRLMPNLSTLIMVDDYIEAPLDRNFPGLRNLRSNVEGPLLESVVTSLPEDMTSLHISVKKTGAPTRAYMSFGGLRRIRKLQVGGFVFPMVTHLSNDIEEIDAIVTWGAVEGLCEAIEKGKFRGLRKIMFRVYESENSTTKPCSSRFLACLDLLISLETANLTKFDREADQEAKKKRRRKRPYVVRQSKASVTFDL